MRSAQGLGADTACSTDNPPGESDSGLASRVVAPPQLGLVERFRSVELFAGGGGLALGLDQAGFDPSLVVESDLRCCDTLAVNATSPSGHTYGWSIVPEDAARVTYDHLDAVDLLSAGPPCQPFSIGGRLSGKNDERDMFPEVLRAARELRPRAILVENVRGLLFPRAQPYFEYLVAQLRCPTMTRRRGEEWIDHLTRLKRVRPERYDYRVDWRVLNAADFGLPQLRPRILVVCLRKDQREWHWPEPTHSKGALIEALWADEYWDAHKVASAVRDQVRARLPRPKMKVGERRWQTLRDLVLELGDPSSTPDPWHVFVPGARLYRKHTGSPLDWPSKTVKAGVHGCPGGEHILLADDGSIRYLTVRECASLQGFPRDYQLPPKRTRAMRQLGNAVPVTLARAMGRRLHEVLSDAG